MTKVDIVVPVYDGYEETVQCIASVLGSVDLEWARLVLINDASPKPEITAYLRELAAANASVVLLENATNLGFVETANRGMAYDIGRDVLLLNSDVEVAGNWLERMRDAAYYHKRVASLTPFSNNATIFSFPNFCLDNELLFGANIGEIDSFFADNFTVNDVIPVATGVGCCMYMRRDCLTDVGYFDAATFGRGYGEENDWCQRAQRAGWHNYHLANCFIYHKGKVSFGEEHSPRIAKAMKILDEKYPSYHNNIGAFVARDPAKSLRLRALLGLFAQQERPKVLCISHKLGGGAQQHVDELANFYQNQALFLQITPERDGESVVLSFYDHGKKLKDGLYFDIGLEHDKLVMLLQELGVGRVHFHHTMGLPTRLWRLAADIGCGYDITIHDYYLINGNPTLTDAEAHFVPEDSEDFDERCAEHYPLPEGVNGALWRKNQTMLVEGAERIIFPSSDSASRFQRFYDIQDAQVSWHPDYTQSLPYPHPVWKYEGGRPLRVLVLGAISREKGANVLESVAEALTGQNVEFHLLGYAYRPLSDAVKTHGPYEHTAVYDLINDIGPDVVWFPALWPETYSYTLSAALHLAMPVVVPNIGAFVERVAGRAQSTVCPWDSSISQWQKFWSQVQRQGHLPAAAAEAQSRASIPAPFYESRYLVPVPERIGELSKETLLQLADNYHAGIAQLSRKERLLGFLWAIARHPAIAKLLALVPFETQRAIKRRLSRRPMHDIVRGE